MQDGKRRKIMWCNKCNKFNHNTCDCFKNPSNLIVNENAVLDEFDSGVDTEGNNSMKDGEIGVI